MLYSRSSHLRGLDSVGIRNLNMLLGGVAHMVRAKIIKVGRDFDYLLSSLKVIVRKRVPNPSF